MMTTKTILISVMMCLNLLINTTFSQAQPKQAPKATTKTLTIADNNKVVRVSTGTTLVIQLEENPSTGYAWHFQNLNAKAFKTLDDQIISSPENKDRMGAPSTRTITLKPQTKGKHKIILNYYRSWENPNTAIQTFKVTINTK